MILCEAEYESKCISEATELDVYTEGFGKFLKDFVIKIINTVTKWFKDMWTNITNFFSNLFNKNKKEQKEIETFIQQHDDECEKGFEIIKDGNLDKYEADAFEKLKNSRSNNAAKAVDEPEDDEVDKSPVALLSLPQANNRSRINSALSKIEGNDFIKFNKKFENIINHLGKSNLNIYDINSPFSRNVDIYDNSIHIAASYGNDEPKFYDRILKIGLKNLEDQKLYNFHASIGIYRAPLGDDETMSSEYVFNNIYSRFIIKRNVDINNAYESYNDIKEHLSNEITKIYQNMHKWTKKRFNKAFKTLDEMRSGVYKIISIMSNAEKTNNKLDIDELGSAYPYLKIQKKNVIK